ncbi:MAG: DUF5615 family PIN-like protein [Gammaproteobacteria bacterium]
MKICFQADADLNQIIVSAALRREPSIDFQTALSAELEGVDDPGVLARAARDGRVLVTHDRKTMPWHFADFISQETSSGLLVIPQSLRVAIAVEDLLLIWSATDAEEWRNRIVYFPL